jgi:hypothetical protein
MTGYPGFNYRAFDEAHDVLTLEGWEVISPADLDRENIGLDFSKMDGTEDLSEYVEQFARQDIDALLRVHAVFVLDGWESSTGARNEMSIAAMIGVPCFSYSTRELLPVEARFAAAGVPVPESPEAEIDPESVSPNVSEALRLVGIDERKVSHRRAILEEAADLVDGDRNAQYGDPRQDFRRTAELWTSYLDGKTVLDLHDVAALMALLKISRIRWSPEKRDSWADLAGYAACGWDCARPEDL